MSFLFFFTSSHWWILDERGSRFDVLIKIFLFSASGLVTFYVTLISIHEQRIPFYGVRYFCVQQQKHSENHALVLEREGQATSSA